MIVADVMTRNVISIAPDATVEDAVNQMLSRQISGLFVVDKAGDLAGVITEGDLLRRDELGTERHRPWWLRLLASPARQAADFTRANGRHVRDVMTEDVVSIAPGRGAGNRCRDDGTLSHQAPAGHRRTAGSSVWSAGPTCCGP